MVVEAKLVVPALRYIRCFVDDALEKHQDDEEEEGQ